MSDIDEIRKRQDRATLLAKVGELEAAIRDHREGVMHLCYGNPTELDEILWTAIKEQSDG